MKLDEYSPSRAGDYAEYKALVWLWDQGYEVFKNSGTTGPVDLIVMDNDGKIILLDVKTFRRTSGSQNSFRKTGERTDHQIELGVQILGYDDRTGEFSFVNHREETTYDRYRNESVTQYDLDLCEPGC